MGDFARSQVEAAPDGYGSQYKQTSSGEVPPESEDRPTSTGVNATSHRLLGEVQQMQMRAVRDGTGESILSQLAETGLLEGKFFRHTVVYGQITGAVANEGQTVHTVASINGKRRTFDSLVSEQLDPLPLRNGEQAFGIVSGALTVDDAGKESNSIQRYALSMADTIDGRKSTLTSESAVSNFDKYLHLMFAKVGTGTVYKGAPKVDSLGQLFGADNKLIGSYRSSSGVTNGGLRESTNYYDLKGKFLGSITERVMDTKDGARTLITVDPAKKKL